MNLIFLNPAAFWGLLALTFPLIIHLLNKSKGTTIWVGNISWIKKVEKTRSRSIRLNEYTLLALRSLIFAALVFILANPVIQSNQTLVKRNLLLIDSEVAGMNLINLKLDTTDYNAYDIRYLHNNKIVNSIDDSVFLRNNLFLALEELEGLNRYGKVVLFSHGYLKNIAGAFPKFSFELTWYQIPSSPGEFPIVKKQFSKDSVLLIGQYLQGNNLISRTEIIDAGSFKTGELGEVNLKFAIIVTEPGFDKEVEEWIRVLEAIARQPEFNFKFKGIYAPESFSEDSLMNTYVIWIGPEPGKDLKSPGVINYNPLKTNNITGPISIIKSQVNFYETMGRITPEAIYNEEFLRTVFELFFGGDVSPEKLQNSDYRQFTQEIEKQNMVAGPVSRQTDFSYPFWLAVFSLIIGERILSKRRGQ
jgi:hypothetical protein